MTELETYSTEEVERLVELAETLQTENETLRAENASLQQTVQSLSERIEKLSKSDLELKASAKLKAQSERAQREAERKRQEALTLAGEARNLMDRAKEKEEAFEEHLDAAREDVAAEARRSLQKAVSKAKVSNSLSTYVLAVYGAVLTLVWAVGEWDIIRTVPEWFVHRRNDMLAIGGALLQAGKWLYERTPETWIGLARAALPILVFAGVAVGLFFAVRAVFWHFKAFHEELWRKYSYRDEKRLKKAFTASLCAMSFLVAVLIVKVWRAQPFNVLSWWLLLSGGGCAAYHIYGYRKD